MKPMPVEVRKLKLLLCDPRQPAADPLSLGNGLMGQRLLAALVAQLLCAEVDQIALVVSVLAHRAVHMQGQQQRTEGTLEGIVETERNNVQPSVVLAACWPPDAVADAIVTSVCQVARCMGQALDLDLPQVAHACITT